MATEQSIRGQSCEPRKGTLTAQARGGWEEADRFRRKLRGAVASRKGGRGEDRIPGFGPQQLV